MNKGYIKIILFKIETMSF